MTQIKENSKRRREILLLISAFTFGSLNPKHQNMYTIEYTLNMAYTIVSQPKLIRDPFFTTTYNFFLTSFTPVLLILPKNL